MFGWVGTITGVTGGITIALNMSYSNICIFGFFGLVVLLVNSMN